MEIYYAQSSLASLTGLSADAATNIFAAQHTGTLSGSDASDWKDAIKTFYDSLVGVDALNGYADTGHTVKFLRATSTIPNYPLFEQSFTLTTPPGPIDLPQEVALCVSYANDSATLVPRARRRGRIYISGWAGTANQTGRPKTLQYEAMATYYKNYVDAVNVISGMTAGVWSRSSNDVFPVERVWCDNEWDTMRSRGGTATVRKTLTI